MSGVFRSARVVMATLALLGVGHWSFVLTPLIAPTQGRDVEAELRRASEARQRMPAVVDPWAGGPTDAFRRTGFAAGSEADAGELSGDASRNELESQEGQPLVLRGVLVGAQRLALLSEGGSSGRSHLVSVGGAVAGWTVTSVDTASVTLVREGSTITLELAPVPVTR